jgi:Cu+-exporting ATPase
MLVEEKIVNSKSIDKQSKELCYHCGDVVLNNHNTINEKKFCCNGCKTVYQIINENDLCEYYTLENTPGLKQNKTYRKGKFDLLENSNVKSKYLIFEDEQHSHVVFYLPQIHCSSCIWILEHMNRVNPHIIKSQVNFIKREITIIYNHQQTKLSKVAENLSLIGYEPHLSLSDLDSKSVKSYDYKQIVKLGVAGFCFGNIMMLSFPEYFSIAEEGDIQLKKLFGYLSLALSLPVFFYSASEFFISGYKGLKQKFLNIDAPIALAILITFVRSLIEILSNTGAGYLDSMSGIVFFMLVGRYVQTRTYKNISFERDFKSYFPLGITVIKDKEEIQKPISEIIIGDLIKVHSDEIIPADGILFYGKGEVDYSFVTGESKIVPKSIGELVYAGGKQKGEAIQLKVVKEVTQSYLTQLWNADTFKEDKDNKHKSFIHKLSKYFTYILFSITIITAIYWGINNPSKIWPSVTAILIIACPCALLLSATFTNGNYIRLLNKHKFFVKNENVIEKIAKITKIVFDKTGTITEQDQTPVVFEGKQLNATQEDYIKTISGASNHPLSKIIYNSLKTNIQLPVTNFKQVAGMGVSGIINNLQIQLGSADFIDLHQNNKQTESCVHVKIENEYLGFYRISNKYREGLTETIKQLGSKFPLMLISGDNESEKQNLQTIFPKSTVMLFNQKPVDKLETIKNEQNKGEIVLMVGDGLNDAGALKQSDVGLAISDNNNNFSPSCDAILLGENFKLLDKFILFCKKQKLVINACFILSILYNLIGLGFAVQGNLKPVIAAILMPVSSLSIIFLTTILSAIFCKKYLTDKSHKLT